MEITYIILALVSLSLILNLFSLFLYYKSYKYFQELNKDTAEALGKTVKLLTDGFTDMIKALQSMQGWNEKAHANVIEVENDNSTKIFKALIREQAFLGKLAEQFGYRPRTDLEE